MFKFLYNSKIAHLPHIVAMTKVSLIREHCAVQRRSETAGVRRKKIPPKRKPSF